MKIKLVFAAIRFLYRLRARGIGIVLFYLISLVKIASVPAYAQVDRTLDFVAVIGGAGDPYLESLVVDAINNSPEIEAAKGVFNASKEDIQAARLARLPSVSVEAFAKGMGDERRDETTSELIVDQPLWTAGRIGFSIDRAKAGKLAARASYQETVFDVTTKVMQLYYEGMAANGRISILQKSLARHQSLVERIERRAEIGISPETDLRLAASRTGQIETELDFARMQFQTAIDYLSELTGRSNDGLMIDVRTTKIHEVILGDDPTEDVLACSPVLRRLRADVGLANTEAKLAKSEIFPQLSLQYAHNDAFGDQVGLKLSASTGNGFSKLSSASAIRQRAVAKRIEIGAIEREIRQAVMRDLVEHRSALSRIETGEAAASSSEEVQASYERQYVAGRRTWLDLMNAVRESTNADQILLESKISALASSTRLQLSNCQWIQFESYSDSEK